MIRSIKFSFIIFLGLFFSGCVGTNKQNPSQNNAKNHQGYELSKSEHNELDQQIQTYIDHHKISGVVAMLAKDGHIIYEQQLGMQDIANGIHMQENTLFRLASLTKPIVSVAALMLIEQGKLKLEDPLYKYIPAFKDVKVYIDSKTTEELKYPVTLKHALTHTIGNGSAFGNGNSPVHKMVAAHDFSHVNTLEEFINELLTFPLSAQPGTVFTYGYSTDVVARVVEVVSGEDIESFLQQNLFTPLKMTDTFFELPKNKASRLGPAYTSKENSLKEVVPAGHNPNRFGRGASGLVSSANDYMRFAQMLLNKGKLEGEQILRPETIDLMTRNHLPKELIPVTIMNIPIINSGFGLGLGIILGDPSEWKSNPNVNMSTTANFPGGSFYWLGAYNDNFWVDPTHQIAGVVMTQSVDVGKIGLFQEFYQIFYQNYYDRSNSREFVR